jgi:hypothetical protein
MSGFFIGTSIVVNTDSAFVHESFSTVGVGTTENVKITASDGAADDQFGSSVAVGSGRIVIGAFGDDDDGSFSGSAYIFDLNGNQLTKITASDGAAGDDFGYSVAVGSGRIVVGAYQDDFNGSAYIFDLDGNQLTKITASDGGNNDFFGRSVAVGSGRIVVGAHQDDDDGSLSGSAYIFDLDGNQLTKITASDGAGGDEFGWSVAVGSGRIVVGARFDHNGSNADQGSAYIFDLNGNQLTKITASDGAANDRFGWSVAVGSGRIVVGAYGDDDNGGSSGSAYIYDLDGSNEVKITASDGAGGDRFGWSVAVGSGRIVVGAYQDDVGSNANQGSAYIFDLDGNQLSKITASDGAVSDLFGYSVAAGSGRIVVGAYLDDDNGSSSGSAYIFNLSEDSNTYWERILETYKY